MDEAGAGVGAHERREAREREKACEVDEPRALLAEERYPERVELREFPEVESGPHFEDSEQKCRRVPESLQPARSHHPEQGHVEPVGEPDGPG